MRLVIQSQHTGFFLRPSPDGDEPIWVRSLREVGPGVITDPERVQQLLEDCTDWDTAPQVIDLDRLGTVNDYSN